MFKAILRTDNGIAVLFLRLSLGVVFFPHGAQKVFGWYGGAGYEKTVEAFTTTMGLPLAIVILLMAIELLGSIGLVVGFFTRLCALGIGGAMAVCALMNHVQNGFFMNWFGTQKGEGVEFHILVLGISLFLFTKGGGFLSIDKAISKL